MTSRLKDLATELETSADIYSPILLHLVKKCLNNQSTQEFLQALKQLSSEFDRIKENQKSRQMGDRLRQIAKEISEMLEDFRACCLMDEQFVS
jgi:hypothetical protein